MPEPTTTRYGAHSSQFVEIWEAIGTRRGSAVLIHGGYWRARYGLDLMDPMARHLAGRGWRVVNIEYRRLGDHDDIWDELSADVLAAAALAGSAREPVVAIGHSAGGHLALWATSMAPTIDAVVALAPVADLLEADHRSLSDGVVRRLLGGDAASRPERYRAASPAHLVPLGVPQLVIHGHNDDSVPLDISNAYAAAAQAAVSVNLLPPTPSGGAPDRFGEPGSAR